MHMGDIVVILDRRQIRQRSGTTREFSSHGISLEMMKSFNYLGGVLLVTDDDWTTVVQNLVKARKVWWRLLRILIREGARPLVYI